MPARRFPPLRRLKPITQRYCEAEQRESRSVLRDGSRPGCGGHANHAAGRASGADQSWLLHSAKAGATLGRYRE